MKDTADMFGGEGTLMKPLRLKRSSGYADQPGTGPDGETCGSCAHRRGLIHARVYYKCALMEHRWTGGPGSDIKVRAPACSKWEAK